MALGSPWKISPLGKGSPAAESFRYGIRVGEDGDHPSDNAARGGIHPCGERRTDSDLFFKGASVDLTFYFHADKQVEHMMVALPQLIDKERFFPEREVSIQAVPFAHPFPAVTDHLGRDMGQQPVDRSAVVRDAHIFPGRSTNGNPRPQ